MTLGRLTELFGTILLILLLSSNCALTIDQEPVLGNEQLAQIESFIIENFSIEGEETVADATIRLLTWLKDYHPELETKETTSVTKGDYGRTFQTYELRYKYTEELIGSREETTSYYPTGELDIIEQKWFDAEGGLLRTRTIKHFTDGRQPVIL